MPRRQLRSVDRRLDLYPFLRTAEQLPQCITTQSLFPCATNEELELEIGTGKGLFLETVSGLVPDRFFLGIEIARKYAEHAAFRLARRGRENAVVVCGDGLQIVRERFPDQSVAAVHVYFPDPWWKAKHRKRRVLNEESLLQLARILKPGARFHFWTDVLEYFESTLSLIGEKFPCLGVPFPEESAEAAHDLDYRTHFERRSRQHSIPVYRVYFQKRELPLNLC